MVLADGAGAGRAVPSGPLLAVNERDFAISTPVAHATAGDVVLRIHNGGPDQHELIVVPLHAGQSPAGLPLRSDGFTVNEERLQNTEPGSINPQQPGGTEYLKVHLAAGRYVLFCNMEGHYMAGMYTELVVTP